jgi:hypothetical protein
MIQQVILRAVMKFIVAMVALVGSFLGVCNVLDYVDDARFDLASHRPVIFSMSEDESNRNWRAATPDTQVAALPDRIVINSNAPAGHYEVIFGPFTTRRGVKYKVSYNLALISGAVTLAVQSNISPESFIRAKLMVPPRGAFTFEAISEITQLELIKIGSLPTVASVSNVLVTETD